jgi:mono/diheme cytochrome c family protein
MKRRPGIFILIGGAVGATALASAAASDGARPAGGDPVNGQRVYEYWCAACHARGPGHPGTQSLAVKYKDQDVPAVIEDRTDLSPSVTAYFVRHGVALMPWFRKTEISDAELRDLGAYLARKEH